MILLRNIKVNENPSDILIDGGTISKIAPAGSIMASGAIPASGVEIADCTGKVAVPGFINMHCHAAMSMMRGIVEDVVFSEWIKKVWQTEAKIDEEFVYWGTKVACLEMIKTGTTTVNDHYWHPYAGHRATVETGIRPATSYLILDREDKEKAERQKDECLKMYEDSRKWNDGSKFSMAFHAVYSVSEEMMVWAAEFARKHGLNLHIHLSETEKEINDCKAKHGGLTPVEYLERIGVLGSNVIAAHTLWLSENDVEILGRRKVNCVHNINSNTKLASGYKFLFKELTEAGANVCIGTDGCASSNNLDILEAIKTSALVQKSWRNDPTAMTLSQLFDMATVNGAKALGLNTGKIEEGRTADICIVDTDNSFFLSPAPFLANFIYSAHSDCIDSVIANGKFVMRHRIVNGEKEILENARKQLYKIK